MLPTAGTASAHAGQVRAINRNTEIQILLRIIIHHHQGKLAVEHPGALEYAPTSS
jgi:hypothetical protein